MRFVLQDFNSKGNVCYPEAGVIDETMRLTNITPEIIKEVIEAGRTEDELVVAGGLTTFFARCAGGKQLAGG